MKVGRRKEGKNEGRKVERKRGRMEKMKEEKERGRLMIIGEFVMRSEKNIEGFEVLCCCFNIILVVFFFSVYNKILYLFF